MGHAISVDTLIVLAFGDEGVSLPGESIESTIAGVVVEKHICLVQLTNSRLAAGFLV